MKLGDKEIKAAKPKAKAYKLADGGGLYLEVLPTGSKSWRLKYRIGGIEKRMTFGLYPVVTLKDARDRAHEARKLLTNSVDPMQVKKDAVAAIRAAAAPIDTFEIVMDLLLVAKKMRASEKHVDDYRRSMEIHVLPTFGNRDIRGISAIEIIALGKKTEDAGRYQAHRIVQRIGEVMDFAVATGRREQNPVTKMTHTILAPHTRENFPAISMDELPESLRDLSRYRGFPITILMLRFMMLTACRTGEARDMVWGWVNMKDALMTIPPTGHKSGRKAINKKKKEPKPHLIPLSMQALELLEEARELTGNTGDQYIFPKYSNYAGKASENVISNALANIGGGKWKGRQSGHGLRRLARTTWGESELFSFEAMETQLAHAIKNETVAAYDHAQLLQTRGKMLQWWADKISAAGSAKVLEFKKAAAAC